MTPEPNSVRDRIDELVNAEIDGVITPAERTELAALLAENPEARQSGDQLRELAGVLAQVEAVEPPEALRRELLAALPIRRVPARQTGFLSRLRETWTTRRVLAYGYGLAAILLLAFVGKEFISPVTTVGENDGVAGTIAPSDPGPTSADSPESDEIGLDLPGLSGSIRLVRQGSETLVEVDAISEAPLVLILGYDGTQLESSEILRTDGLAAPADTAPGRVVLGGETATGVRTHAYRIRLSEIQKSMATTVHFTFVGAGDPVHAGSLTVGAGGRDPDRGSSR